MARFEQGKLVPGLEELLCTKSELVRLWSCFKGMG